MLFSLSGGVGFISDFTAFLLLQMIFNPHVARLFSFIVAVNITYYLNETLTFHDRKGHIWLYVLGQTKGFIINYMTFEGIYAALKGIPYNIYIAFIAGSMIALGFNYFYAKIFAFREY
ncbi:MAG: GtrA family protein [Planctomycetes bacterium]|nr:GtrA family protein [Planctomycetota bacterium]